MSVFRALHLSDLHIGDTYLPSQDLAYKISNDIARNGIRDIRSILVTGDIFHGPAGLQVLAPGRNSHFGCNRNRQFELR